MGAEAVMALMDATPETEPCVVSLAGNVAIRLPLMECVMKTKAVAKAMEDKDFQKAVELRGKSFQRNLETYLMLARPKAKILSDEHPVFNMGVIHIGAPCCGMNAAVRSFVRNVIASGNKAFGIHRGIEGLLADEVEEMTWGGVNGWAVQGGALLGIKRTLPEGKYEKVAAQVDSNN
jgi:6-phosphofructokinase 1